MYALISMGLALTLLVVLLHYKIKLGRAMILSAFTLAVLLRVTPSEFLQTITQEWQNKPLNQTTGYLFVTLTALVMLVNVLGTALKETGVSVRLVPAIQGLFRSRRLALAAIPMMMGLLPTPGGIMLSAPMVRDLGDSFGIERSRLAAINFYFRHQWEAVWPLFPSIPLVQGMFGISALTLISYNIIIPITGIVTGIIFLLLKGIPAKNKQKTSHDKFNHNLRNFIHAFWPILLVAILHTSVNLTPAAGLFIAVIIFLLIHKVSIKRWSGIFKSGLEPDFALLILGALLFKVNLEAGKAIDDVVLFLSDMNVSSCFVIFFLPMLVSFLTGLTMPTIAITFPFLVPFIGTGAQAEIGLETLAFSGLICGLLITPVHLCMALSAGYFETPLIKIVTKILWPVVFIAAAGVLMVVFSG